MTPIFSQEAIIQEKRASEPLGKMIHMHAKSVFEETKISCSHAAYYMVKFRPQNI